MVGNRTVNVYVISALCLFRLFHSVFAAVPVYTNRLIYLFATGIQSVQRISEIGASPTQPLKASSAQITMPSLSPRFVYRWESQKVCVLDCIGPRFELPTKATVPIRARNSGQSCGVSTLRSLVRVLQQSTNLLVLQPSVRPNLLTEYCVSCGFTNEWSER